MTSIFIVPKDVLNTVLTGWCSLDALQKLDSAFCNREQRSLFLSLLVNDTFRLDLLSTYIDRPHLSWLSHRQVKIRSLSLCKRDFDGDVLRFNINLQEVNRIELADSGVGTGFIFDLKYRQAGRVSNEPKTQVANMSQRAILNVLNACPKLTLLIVKFVEHFNDNTVDLIPQHILDKIISVEFTVSSAEFTGNGLLPFAKNLEHCYIHRASGVTEHDIIQLMKTTNGKLKRMYFLKRAFSDVFFQTILDHCPLLETMSLIESCEGVTNIILIANMIQNCKMLTYAFIQGDEYNCISYYRKKS